MSFSRLFTIFGLIALGVLSRLIPHPPNFTSINAIALFGSFYFANPFLSFAIVFSTLFFSDLAIGFHPMMAFVYFSFGLIVAIGYSLPKKISLAKIPLISFATSLLFFVVTNFGEWFCGNLYQKTLQGLGCCYLAAIPFFTTQAFGDLSYNILLFGLLKLGLSWKENTKIFPRSYLNEK